MKKAPCWSLSWGLGFIYFVLKYRLVFILITHQTDYKTISGNAYGTEFQDLKTHTLFEQEATWKDPSNCLKDQAI